MTEVQKDAIGLLLSGDLEDCELGATNGGTHLSAFLPLQDGIYLHLKLSKHFVYETSQDRWVILYG